MNPYTSSENPVVVIVAEEMVALSGSVSVIPESMTTGAEPAVNVGVLPLGVSVGPAGTG